MLALGLLALAAGLAIALVAGTGGKRHHRRSAAARIAAGSSATAGASAPAGAAGTDRREAETPSRVVLAADYLGLTVAQLHDRLKQGRSLADIAARTGGKSTQGLIEALVTAEATRMREAKLSAATQRTRLTRYRQRIERLVAHRKAAPAIERDLLAASAYLGVGDGHLHTLLAQGHTLAQIAAVTHGRTVAGLRDAILATRRARVHAAASSGLLSHKGEQAALAALPGVVEAELRRSLLQSSKG